MQLAIAAQSTAYIPPGVYLQLDDAGNGRVRARVLTAQVEAIAGEQLRKGLAEARKGNADLDRFLSPSLKDIRFVRFSAGGDTIGLQIKLETRVSPFGLGAEPFDCDLNLSWRLPLVKLEKAKFVDAGTWTVCRTESILLHGLRAPAEKALKEMLIMNIEGGQLLDTSNLLDWIKEDPDWAAFAQTTMVTMVYCEGPAKEPSLCFDLTWPDSGALASWRAGLINSAPVGKGAADKVLAAQEANEYLTLAWSENAKPAKASSNVTDGKYPAERHADGTYNDFDMALFGGLVCLSGEERGCELVRKSQGINGRFWRAPDRVEGPINDGAPFSGDAFTGVVAYFANGNDKDAFVRYLQYIVGNKTTVAGAPVYKSCTNDDALQCVLSGPEWYWLSLLAKKFGVEGSIPGEVRDVKGVFGFDEEMMVWQAALAPAGYRLHLTAVQVALARKLYGDTPTLKRAAATLAARQPKNPFHLYLHLGSDMLAQESLGQACKRGQPQTDYWDWAWQRATSEKAWERSMRWDCLFMHRLLAS